MAPSRITDPQSKFTAIETCYAGCRFRSRTEARWAVFFDALGEPWEYEREGFALPSGPYLPDFYLRRLRLWVEVKGESPTIEESRKCEYLALYTNRVTAIVVGSPSGDAEIQAYLADETDDGSTSVGWWHECKWAFDRHCYGQLCLCTNINNDRSDRILMSPCFSEQWAVKDVRGIALLMPPEAFQRARSARFDRV